MYSKVRFNYTPEVKHFCVTDFKCNLGIAVRDYLHFSTLYLCILLNKFYSFGVLSLGFCPGGTALLIVKHSLSIFIKNHGFKQKRITITRKIMV